jgi:hypothetical protein
LADQSFIDWWLGEPSLNNMERPTFFRDEAKIDCFRSILNPRQKFVYNDAWHNNALVKNIVLAPKDHETNWTLFLSGLFDGGDIEQVVREKNEE